MSDFNTNLTGLSPYTVVQTDAVGNPSTPPIIVDSSAIKSVDYEERLLFDESNLIALDFNGRILYDDANVESLLWQSRILYDTSTIVAIDWSNRILMDEGNLLALDWVNRILHSETANSLDWSGTSTPSATIVIDSTTQGVLLPRMTTTQRTSINSPAEGLLVYDLTLHQLFYFNGTLWVVA